MHHEITGKPPEGYITDHKNGQDTDNRRKNLRFVTNRQNCQNRKNQESSSQYPGICWHEGAKKWMARLQINGKTKYIGIYCFEIEAFNAYKQAVNAIGETMLDNKDQ